MLLDKLSQSSSAMIHEALKQYDPSGASNIPDSPKLYLRATSGCQRGGQERIWGCNLFKDRTL